MRSSLILNVNKEGTGGIILCPAFFNCSQTPLDDPVATINLSAISVSPEVVETFHPPSSVCENDLTPEDFLISTLALSAISIKQSAIVDEESVIGNTRLSPSILSSTPRSANHSMVSPG